MAHEIIVSPQSKMDLDFNFGLLWVWFWVWGLGELDLGPGLDNKLGGNRKLFGHKICPLSAVIWVGAEIWYKCGIYAVRNSPNISSLYK